MLRRHQLPDIQCCTNIYDGYSLRMNGREAELNVLTHPFVFYDATHGQSKEASVELAAYLPDSVFSRSTYTRFNLPINPATIEGNWSNVKLDFPNEQATCSSSNANVTIVTSLPAVLFYSVCRVHYDNKPVRSALTLHIVLLDQTLPLALYLQAWTQGRERGLDSGQLFASLWQQLAERTPGEESFGEVVGAWMHANPADEMQLYANFLKRVIWASNGRPRQDNFGDMELQNWRQKDPTVMLPWFRQICRIAWVELTRWLFAFQFS